MFFYFFKDMQFCQATLCRPVIVNRRYTYPLGVRSAKAGVRSTKIVRDARPENLKKCVVDCCECSKLLSEAMP